MKQLRLLGGLLFLLLSKSLLFAQNNTFPTSGYVGIGTTSPVHDLHLKGPDGNRARFEFGYKAIDIVSYLPSYQDYSNSQGIYMWGTDGLIMTGENSNLRIITNDGNFTERVRILANGNMGIGTKTPQYLLSVNGTIGTKEIHVTATGWADYVFKKDYQLMPLAELETFIQENGHLPDVPTEKEVLEYGVNLLEMNVKLLEKVEELTLYVIGLKKEIDQLKK